MSSDPSLRGRNFWPWAGRELRTGLFLTAILLGFILTGCTSVHQAETFLWPDKSDHYFSVTEKWTRIDALYSGLDTQIKIYATLASPAWRTAYAERRARIYALSPEEKKKLEQDQLQALKRGTDIIVAAASSFADNRKLEYSSELWKTFLLDSQGNKIYPLESREAPWSPQQMQNFLPHYSQWQKVFWLRFPPQQPDTLHLVITGPLGQLDFLWNENS